MNLHEHQEPDQEMLQWISSHMENLKEEWLDNQNEDFVDLCKRKYEEST